MCIYFCQTQCGLQLKEQIACLFTLECMHMLINLSLRCINNIISDFIPDLKCVIEM